MKKYIVTILFSFYFIPSFASSLLKIGKYVFVYNNTKNIGDSITSWIRIDVSGGWHDASDYLQYATTSANATYHLLAAYRDFPEVFTD